MDETEIMQTETAESEVDAQVEETEVQDTTDLWDDDWSDLEDEDFSEDGDGDDEEFEDGHPEKDEDTAKESSTDSEEEVEPEEAKPEVEEAKAKLFHLKHLNDEVDVDETEVIKLAQKGMDYDFIRGERDNLKTKIADYEEAYAFVNELAANSEQTVEELIDATRTRLLVARERREGRTVGEAEAMQRVQRERANRRKAATPEPTSSPKEEGQQGTDSSPEAQWQTRQQQIVKDFVRAFPNLDPKTIPKDIFMKGLENGNLVEETMKWQEGEKNKEIEKLRSENERLKQNQKNKARSTGSRQSVGKARSKDPYDDGWYDD